MRVCHLVPLLLGALVLCVQFPSGLAVELDLEMEEALLLQARARVRSRARFDLGEHGTMFNKLAGVSEFRAQDNATYTGAELVGFFGDFMSECDLRRVICESSNMEKAARELVDTGYKLNSKDPGAARWLKNMRRLRADEFKVAYNGNNPGTGDFPPTVKNGGMTPARPIQFWASPWMAFNFSWVNDPLLSTRTPIPCLQLATLNANNDHFSTCARRTGEVLVRLGLTHLAENKGAANEHWGFFALFAALHMLTDQFAPGHVRVPAIALRRKCVAAVPSQVLGGVEFTGGLSVNAMHDLDNTQGLHLARGFPVDLNAAPNQKTTLSGKEITTFWKGFGDHRYYTPENADNKKAIEQFISFLADFVTIYRTTTARATSSIRSDVTALMALVPQWRWSPETVRKDQCPFYLVNCKPSNKGKVAIEVENGEILEPDCGIQASDLSDVWRLRHPTEKDVPVALQRNVSIKGTSTRCDYVAFHTPADRLLHPTYAYYAGCFTVPSYTIACTKIAINFMDTQENPGPVTSKPNPYTSQAPNSNSLQPWRNWMTGRSQTRTTKDSKCYVTSQISAGGINLGADWSYEKTKQALPGEMLVEVAGGAPDSWSTFTPVQ